MRVPIDISVHIGLPAGLDGRVYSLLSQPLPVHVLHPGDKIEGVKAGGKQAASWWHLLMASSRSGTFHGQPEVMASPHHTALQTIDMEVTPYLALCRAALSWDGSGVGWLASAIMSRIFWRHWARLRNW